MLPTELMIYCNDKGRFFLKVKGGEAPTEFGRIDDAFRAAAQAYPKAPIVVYDAVGRVVMDTAVVAGSWGAGGESLVLNN